MPLLASKFKKLVYFTQNKIEFKPKWMFIMPYLHERRIYLNRYSQKTYDDKQQQFYHTTLDNNGKTKFIEVNLYKKEFIIFKINGVMLWQESFKDVLQVVMAYAGDVCIDPEQTQNEYKFKIESISNNGLVLAFRSGDFIRIFNLKDRIEKNRPQKDCLTDYLLKPDLEKIFREKALAEFFGKDQYINLEDIDVSMNVNDN